MVVLPLSMTLIVDPCHGRLKVVSHLLIHLIHMLHGQTSCVTLSFQLLSPNFRAFIFLLHLLHLRNQRLDDTLELLNLTLMVHLLRKLCRLKLIADGWSGVSSVCHWRVTGNGLEKCPQSQESSPWSLPRSSSMLAT